MNYGYVYKGTNLVNNKIYIGQHKSEKFDESYLGSGTLWKRAIQKYGVDKIQIEVIEFCSNPEELNKRESYWIKKLNSQDKTIGYNICGSDTSPHSLPGDRNPMYGKHHTYTSKKKISEKAKGRRVSDETKLKISNILKGREVSKETREKKSKKLKGVKPSPQCVEAVKKANSRPVEVLDENYNVVRTFEKATDMPEFFGVKNYSICFTNALKSNCTKMYKGYYIRYLNRS